MKKILVLIFLFTSLLFFSCTEEIKPTKFTYSELLTGQHNKTWKITRLTLRVEGEEDERIDLNDCESDDRYIFYANSEKLFEVTNGSSKCPIEDGEEDDLLLSYTWSLNNANATLNMVAPHIFGYYLLPFIVKEMDDSDMELEFYLNEEATVSYVLLLRRTDEE